MRNAISEVGSNKLWNWIARILKRNNLAEEQKNIRFFSFRVQFRQPFPKWPPKMRFRQKVQAILVFRSLVRMQTIYPFVDLRWGTSSNNGNLFSKIPPMTGWSSEAKFGPCYERFDESHPKISSKTGLVFGLKLLAFYVICDPSKIIESVKDHAWVHQTSE